MDLEVRALDYAEQVKLAAEIGYPGMAAGWWTRAMIFASVRKIDGRPVMMPQTPQHIRDIAARIGGDAMAKIRAAMPPVPVSGEAPNIRVEPLSEVEKLDFFEAFGEVADIAPFAGLALPAWSVREINGQSVEPPKTMRDLLARMRALGTAGMNEAARLLVPDDDKPDPKSDVDAAKN